MPGTASLPFTDNDDANRLLASNPLALMIGMLLDQQFPMERAFFSPYLLAERLGGSIEAEPIAAMDEERIVEVFQGPPRCIVSPVRWPSAPRSLCEVIVEEYDGDAARVWTTAEDGKDLLKRLEALPGFGKAKARIFVGIVGKRLGQGPTGWEAAAADWPSIADVDTFEKIYELREHKRAMKAAKKAAQ